MPLSDGLVDDRQLFEPARGRDSRFEGFPGRKRPLRRWCIPLTAGAGVFVAVLELLANLHDLLLDLVALGHDDAGAVRERQKVRDRQSLLVVVEPLANRHDGHVIDGAGRSLRGRIKPAQGFDHVADELEPDGLDVARWKHVEDAAADREGPVLVHWIGTGETGVNEQIGERLRIDLCA